MPRVNFSKDENETFGLMLDLARNQFEFYVDKDKVTKKDLEDELRNRIKNDMLKGRSLYQAYRRNNLVFYEIVEEIVNVTIAEDVLDSPFINSFVEVKNRALGDDTRFYSEGGLLSVASFAGNHWTTDRQSLDVGEEITLPKEWAYIHVYDDLERFITGAITLEKVTDKIYKSINKFIQDRIYAQFQNIANATPAEFTGTGNTEQALAKIVDLVQAAGGYSSITIAGTKSALRKLAGVVPDKMFANSQKEAKAQTGSIAEWEGNNSLVIPQTLKSGTFELALSDDTVFIFDGDCKPIKLEFFGDTRTKVDEDGSKNPDQSVDMQVQTKFGIGLVMSSYFGTFTFA